MTFGVCNYTLILKIFASYFIRWLLTYCSTSRLEHRARPVSTQSLYQLDITLSILAIFPIWHWQSPSKNQNGPISVRIHALRFAILCRVTLSKISYVHFAF